MILLTALLVGFLVGAGVWQLSRRSAFEMLLGLLLLSQATNVLIIAASGWRLESLPPITEPGDPAGPKVSSVDPSIYADPLPHALILTAIVIGFGVFSFLMVLLARGAESTGNIELGEDPPTEEKAP